MSQTPLLNRQGNIPRKCCKGEKWEEGAPLCLAALRLAVPRCVLEAVRKFENWKGRNFLRSGVDNPTEFTHPRARHVPKKFRPTQNPKLRTAGSTSVDP